MKKRILSMLLTFTLLVGCLPMQAFADEVNKQQEVKAMPFSDVLPTDWFYDAVQFVYENNVFRGITDDTYAPKSTVTRAMFLTTLGRFAGVDTTAYGGNGGFTDVKTDAYYAPYVVWAAEKGITAGVGGGLFGVDQSVTREQIATLTAKFFDVYQIGSTSAGEAKAEPQDMAAVSSWALSAEKTLWQAGLFKGDQNGNFSPLNAATRAEIAQYYCNLAEVTPTAKDAAKPSAGSEAVKPDETKPDAGSSSSAGGSGQSKVTITYETNGAGDLSPTSVAKGSKVGELPRPLKDGYIFLGWYTDENLTQAVTEDTVATGNMKLYAQYAELTIGETQPEETLNVGYVAEEKAVNKNHSVAIATKDLGITAENIKSMITLTTVDQEDTRDPMITGGDGAFQVTMPDGFTEGNSYVLQLHSEQLYFTDKEESAREYYFNIAREQSDQLPIRDTVHYAPFAALRNVKVNNQTVNSLSVPVVTIAPNGETVDNDVAGSFQYQASEVLEVGDVLCIYSGNESPQTASEQDLVSDDIAYVKITEISDSSYSFTNAELEDVLCIPETLALSKNVAQNQVTTNEGFTFGISNLTDVTPLSYIDGDIDLGDVVVVYDGASLDDQNINIETDEGVLEVGQVTGIVENDSDYTVVCKKVSEDELNEQFNYYQELDLDTEGLAKINTNQEAVLQELRQQTLDSGIIDQLAESYAVMVLETDMLEDVIGDTLKTVALSDGTQATGDQLQMIRLANKNQKIKVSNVKVTPKLVKGTHLDGKAYGAEITVGFNVDFKTEGGDTVSITYNVVFTQEVGLGLSMGVDADVSWRLKLKKFKINIDFDVKTYTGIHMSATLTTKSVDAGKSVDVSGKIQAIMKTNNEAEAISNVSGIYKIYQDFMKNDMDYIEMVRAKIFTVPLAGVKGLCSVDATFYFVVSLAMNATVGCDMSYKEGTRYWFRVDVLNRSVNSGTSRLLDKTFEFTVYVAGNLGIRAGIEAAIGISILKVFGKSLASANIAAQLGVYLKYYGLCAYTYCHNFSRNTKTSNLMGAMYSEFGTYLTLKLKVQALWFEKEFGLLDQEWPLLSTNTPNYVYDFSYDLPKVEKIIINKDKNTLPDYALKMKRLDMQKGTSNVGGYNLNDFNVAFTNKDFSINPSNGKISVKGNQDYAESDMTITWKKHKFAFSSAPIKRTFRVVFTDSSSLTEKALLTVNFNGNTVWQKRVDLNADLKNVLPTESEVRRLAGFDNYDVTLANGKVVNARYENNGSFDKTSGKITNSMTVEYKVNPRTYSVDVKDIQNLNGSTTSRTFTTKYGEKFDLSSLATTKTEKNGAIYTKFSTVETRNNGKAAGVDLKGTVDAALARQLLSGEHTYHATYADNSVKATYVFVLGNKELAKTVHILKAGEQEQFNCDKYVTDSMNDKTLKPLESSISTGALYTDKTFKVVLVDTNIKLILHLNGGTLVGYTAPSAYNPSTGDVKLPTNTQITKSDYVFGGWYNTEDFSGTPITDLNQNFGTNFYAKWVQNTNTITFDSNDGVGFMDGVSSAQDNQLSPLPEPTFKKAGEYLTLPFMGWSTTKGGNVEVAKTATIGQALSALESGNGGGTLYAVWGEEPKCAEIGRVLQATSDQSRVAVQRTTLGTAIRAANGSGNSIIIKLKEDIELVNTIHLNNVCFDGEGHTITAADIGVNENGEPNDTPLFIKQIDAYDLSQNEEQTDSIFRISNFKNVWIKNLKIIGGRDSAIRVAEGASDNAELLIQGVSISRAGKRDTNGGAFKINAGANDRIRIENTIIENCMGNNGGGIYASGASDFSSQVQIFNTSIINCTATDTGGALFNHNGSLVANNAVFANNTAENCGAMALDGTEQVLFSNCSITGNHTNHDVMPETMSGGAFNTSGCFANSIIAGNTVGNDVLTYCNLNCWKNSARVNAINCIIGSVADGVTVTGSTTDQDDATMIAGHEEGVRFIADICRDGSIPDVRPASWLNNGALVKLQYANEKPGFVVGFEISSQSHTWQNIQSDEVIEVTTDINDQNRAFYNSIGATTYMGPT